MSDSYPEHLNPFAVDDKPKNKLTLRDSFKEFKRNLRQSFRIKKKEHEDVTIRQKIDTPRRLPLSYPSPQSEALPRSRFRERVGTFNQSSSLSGSNPFEEDPNKTSTPISTFRRRGKKRAPLPPMSLSSQNISNNLDVSSSGSHWSLTSVDTDISGSTDNGIREEYEDESREIMIDKFKDFNKNMEALKDDDETNNNVITKEDTGSNINIPDLVISCPSDKGETKVDKPTEGDSEESEASEEIVVTDVTDNMVEIKEENKEVEVDKEKPPDETQSEEKTEDPEILYSENKSLYIAGSRDELNDTNTYTGRVSLYITGSCDGLDASNNNEVCNKSVTDENSNADAVPTPKQRKTKLSKNILLGM